MIKITNRFKFGNFTAPRNPAFASVKDSDVNFFKNVCGDKSVITDEQEVKSFNTDWTKKFIGSSRVFVKPETTLQVSQILKHCNTWKLAVVPQGGNTGLVGGSVPVHDEIILNMGRMNRILGYD